MQNQSDIPVWINRSTILGELYVCDVQGHVQINSQSAHAHNVDNNEGTVEGLDFSQSSASPEDIERVTQVISNYPHAFSQSDTVIAH